MASPSRPDRVLPAVDRTLRNRVDEVRFWLGRHERLLWGLVLIALGVDLASTLYGFHLGFTERNPLARGLVDAYGVAGIVGLKVGALGLAVLLRSLVPAGYRGVVPLALAAPWWVAALSNAYVLISVS